MHEKFEKPKVNKSRAVANSVTQKQSSDNSALQFVDNRPETFAQRKLKDMANNSPQVKQLGAFKGRVVAYDVPHHKSGMKNGFGFADNRGPTMKHARINTCSRGAGYEERHTLVPSNGEQVAQLAYDDAVKPGVFNMVGENHKKTEVQREKEKLAAAKADLFYYTENELFTLNNGLNDTKADPNNLRILFALAKIKEAILSIVYKRNVGVKNEKMIIKYVIRAMKGDIDEFQDDTVKESFSVLNENIDKHDPVAVLKTISDMVIKVDPSAISLGSSENLSVARSEAMHTAATDGMARKILWMVGWRHTDDIDKIHGSTRNYTMLKQGAVDKLIHERLMH